MKGVISLKDFEIIVCYDAEMQDLFIEMGTTNCGYEARSLDDVAEAVKDFIKEYINR